MRSLRSGLVVFVALWALPASAQIPASNLEELRFKIGPGDSIYVTDTTGSEHKARVLDFSPSALVVSIGGARRSIAEADLLRIRQRQPDPLLNGALIGAAATVTASTVGALAFADRSEGESFGWADVGFILYLGSIGAGVGTGIDALIRHKKVIYETPGGRASPSIGIAPLLSASTRGIRVSFRF